MTDIDGRPHLPAMSLTACVASFLPRPQVRTAVNMLGPLLNPAHAEYGLVGVYSTDISHLMADALLVSQTGGALLYCQRTASGESL
jgi:anthranilate phosphoribosyltransferase